MLNEFCHGKSHKDEFCHEILSQGPNRKDTTLKELRHELMSKDSTERILQLKDYRYVII